MKQLVANTPVLQPINYTSSNSVILSVDTSKIAVDFILSQVDDEERKRSTRYDLISMNEREANYSQSKLELYDLFCAL